MSTIDATGNIHDRSGKFAGHVRGEGPDLEMAAGFDNGCARCDSPAGDDGLCDAHTERWGDVSSIREGSRTPWGPAQHVENPAPGIAIVDTAGHGGIKLSPERNKAIPLPLRISSGWYEEDCEAAIVAMYHPDGFPHWNGGDHGAIVEDATLSVKNWSPDRYEQATGNKVRFGQSIVRDEETYNQLHAGEKCLYTTNAKEHPDYPGMVVVTTDQIPTGQGNFTRHMIPLADYQEADRNRAFGKARVCPLLPASAVEVPEAKSVAQSKKDRPAITAFNTEGLTPAARQRAISDLGKRWRDSTGRVYTMSDEIASGRFNGKEAITRSDGKTSYFLRNTGEAYMTPVSKALWDAYEAPDERTPAEHAKKKWLLAEASAERARSNFDRAGSMKFMGQATAFKAQLDRLRSQEEAAARPAREAAEAARQAEDRARLDAAYRQVLGRRTPSRP